MDARKADPGPSAPQPAKMSLPMIPLIAASFAGGASFALGLFLAHPLSPSFWRRFGEFWGFLWLWQRSTLCAMGWSALLAVALLVHRPRTGGVRGPQLALAGSFSGLLTSAIVFQFAHLFGSSAWLWLGLGALLGVLSTLGVLSWLAAREFSRRTTG